MNIKKNVVSAILEKAKETKLFWHIYFWWGIRQARMRRIDREKYYKVQPKITNDEYWENKHRGT